MNEQPDLVNSMTVAPLANVTICMAAVQRTMQRAPHLPGMVTFYGPSGWGKSTAAAYVANKTRAYYVQCMSAWTKKAFLENVLSEMGCAPSSTIASMTEQAAEQLALSNRPLIIDEMDHLADKKAVEIVRDLYEASGGGTILLIGEERLPDKLRKWERVHGRVLDWVQAQPADLDDAKHLARIFTTRVKVANDLLGRIAELAKGSARRICVNLDRVEQFALTQGLEKIDLVTWGNNELFTGEAPKRRV
ncbi:DNA transposition protein [Solemya pervernicosa gill symbiont]|uniref:DNA transposition protein n=1 Tax=Solemya pervernicosa gill symbiont TaxID=642797 RepID=A0A1T2L9M8_9GAMM|nr:ATP-binding protein [Solemya pervernicosa gill symbiont]OOZ41636.1 DNA transposition protein [Solemya pervernicosa gill symbiont]